MELNQNAVEKRVQDHPKVCKGEVAPKHHQHLGDVASIPHGRQKDTTEDLLRSPHVDVDHPGADPVCIFCPRNGS